MRQASAGGLLATPRGRNGRMADVDVQLLSRVLKTLERSVRAAEDVDPFPQTVAVSQSASGSLSARASPVKKSKKVKKAKGGSDDGMGGDDIDLLADELDQGLKEVSSGVDDFALEKLTRDLDVAIDSILAAECCIAVLASDRLPKQV